MLCHQQDKGTKSNSRIDMILHLLYNEVSGLQIALDNYDFRTNLGPILTAFALDSMWQEVDVGNSLDHVNCLFCFQ